VADLLLMMMGDGEGGREGKQQIIQLDPWWMSYRVLKFEARLLYWFYS
jgi:hypothetical protein